MGLAEGEAGRPLTTGPCRSALSNLPQKRPVVQSLAKPIAFGQAARTFVVSLMFYPDRMGRLHDDERDLADDRVRSPVC